MEKLKELRMSVIILLIGVFFISGCFFNNSHTVTFKTNGGTEIKEITVKDGNTIENIQEPKKSGYVFSGWYLDGEEFDKNSKIEEDIVLVAKWNKVTLNEDDETEEESTTTSTTTTTKKTTSTKSTTKKTTTKKVTTTNKLVENFSGTTTGGSINSGISEPIITTTSSELISTTEAVVVAPTTSTSTTTSTSSTTTSTTTTTTTTTTNPITPGDTNIPEIPDTPETPDVPVTSNIKYGIELTEVDTNKEIKIIKVEDESNIDVKISESDYNKFLNSDINNWRALSNNGVKTNKNNNESTLIWFKLEKEEKEVTSFSLVYGNSNEAILFKLNEETDKWEATYPAIALSTLENSLEINYYIDLKTAIANANKSDVITILSDQIIDGSLIINKPIKLIGKNGTNVNIKISNNDGYILDISKIVYEEEDELLIKNIDFDAKSFINVGNSNFTNIRLDNVKLNNVENLYSSNKSSIQEALTDLEVVGAINQTE